MIALLWLACRCQEPAAPTVVSHFASFDQLVFTAVTGDVAGARSVAASLQEGEVDGDALAAVGGALGFVQVAEDPEEVVDGVAAAAVACGRCHGSVGVTRPALGPWDHRGAGLRMALGAVFPPVEVPVDTGSEVRAARAAWLGAVPEEGEDDVMVRLAAALVACEGCHEG